jgi:hypothetical protein
MEGKEKHDAANLTARKKISFLVEIPLSAKHSQWNLYMAAFELCRFASQFP